MLEQYRSLASALLCAYPDRQWEPHPQSKSVSMGFWNDQQNIRGFMDSIKEKYNFSSPQDWYNSHQILLKEGGSYVLNLHGGLGQLLKVAYPEQEWIDFKKQDGYWSDSANVIVCMTFIK